MQDGRIAGWVPSGAAAAPAHGQSLPGVPTHLVRPSPPPPQLNLVVVRDGPQPQLLPHFNVGPVKLGWSINVDGKYVSGFLG